MSDRRGLVMPPSDGSGQGASPDGHLAALATGLSESMSVLRLEPDLGFEYVSPSVEALVGYTPEEHYADPQLGWRMLDPRDVDEAGPAVAEAELGEVAEFTVRLIRKDGATVWTHHRCRKQRRDDGSLVLYGLARDVTDQVQREQALAAREERLRLMLENVTDVVLDFAPDRTFRWVSPSVKRILGWEPSQLVGKANAEFIHPDDRPGVAAARESPRQGKAEYPRVRILQADGGYRWMSGVTRELRDAEGVLLGRVAGLHDVDDVVRAEQALAASEDYYRLLAENGSDLVFRADRDGVTEWMSPSVTSLLGWAPADMVGHPGPEFIHPDDLPGRESASETINAGQRGEYEARLRTADGGYRWMAVTLRPVLDSHGDVVGRIGSARDIQAEVAARQDLARSEQRVRLAMESAPVGMAVADLDRRFLEVNPALCRMLDRDESWLLSHRFPDVLEVSFEDSDLQMRAGLLSGRSTTAAHEKVLVRADGSTVWVEHSIGLLRDDYGLPQAYVCQFVDITQAKQGRDRLEDLAKHDPLTHLLTRAALLEGIERIVSHPRRKGTRLGVLFIDIDRFKEANDRHGHLAGDQVLQAVAQRATASARADDLVARVGGDEIVVALPTIHDAAYAEAVASKIQTAMHEPVLVDGGPIHATVSIGIAVAQPGEDAEQVIRRADRALYRAKRTGRDRTVTYDPGIDTGELAQPSD